MNSKLPFRLFLLALLLAFSASPAAAQTYRYDTGFTLSERNFCDTIPLEYKDGQIFVTLKMGNRTLRALLDTGAAQGVVFSNQLPGNLVGLGNLLVVDGNGRQDTVSVVQLPTFSIGTIRIEGYVATVHRPMPMHQKYDLILGFDLFNKGIAAKIDTRAGQLILSDRRNAFRNEPGQALKYKLKWFVPYCIVSPFVRHADETLFDTGYRGYYTMNHESFEQHAYKSRNVGSQIESVAVGQHLVSLFGTDESQRVAFLRLNRLQWNRFEFRLMRSTTTSGSSKMGGRLLQYGSWIILPRQKKIVFQPYGNADFVEVNNRSRSMAFVPSQSGVVVGLVNPESEAYYVGVRAGDVVLKIDNRAINGIQDIVGFPFAEGKPNQFTLQDSTGRIKTVVVER